MVADPSASRRGTLRDGRGTRFDAANRYGLVIGLIGVTYVVSAAAEQRAFSSVVLLVQLATVWLVFSVSESRRARRVAGITMGVAACVALLGLVIGPTTPREGATELDLTFFALSVLLYLIAPLVILRHLVRRPVIDVQTLLGAIATYLLLGMMFAFAYRAVGSVQTDPAFFGAAGRGSMSQDLFFSFITLTTTGYGDLVPQANPGQTMAVLEAILGQLFLVTAVAKIVADLSGRGRRRDPPRGVD